MNQMEYELLFKDKSLSAHASALYLFLRGSDENAFLSKYFTYIDVIHKLTYMPPHGSKEPMYKPKRQDIRHFLNQLSTAGLIEWDDLADRFRVEFPIIHRGNQ